MPLSTAQKSFSRAMLKATKLTGVGKLMDATRVIQHTLFGATPQPKAEKPAQPVIILPAAPEYLRPTPPTSPAPSAPSATSAKPGRKASFTKHSYTFDGDSYPYRLYIPAATADEADMLMPLVVLLHGCQQDALDFAHGTAMNTLAGQHNAMVLYPEQISSGNAMMCWNWFDTSHQQAGQGEPGMIAALTQKTIAQHGADPERIYVAGLSAGGAMAAVVAGLYPKLFAAVGVHSGLAAGAAQDMMSAFSAMQSGAKGHKTTALPTIVFHGTGDTTVNPDNSEFITDAALAALKASGQSLVKSKSKIETGTALGNPEYAERTVYSDASGTPFVESWSIPEGTHAWSGGSAQGSYTDPDGPDASAAMLAFFLQHTNPHHTP